MADGSDVSRRLKALREKTGLTMREVAEALGWTQTRYQHYEARYSRKFLPMELARLLAGLFGAKGVDPHDVLALAGLEGGTTVSIGGLPGGRIGEPLIRASASRDLPVMGAVKGGSTGFYFNEGEPKEFVARPAVLASARNAFALYVDGDSMEPRYFAGEVLYVNPNRPITKSCFVAVEMNDGRGMIKQFLRRSDDAIVLHQFNPPKDIRLAARDVKQVYRIVGAGEASG